jgi:hypothetical protein
MSQSIAKSLGGTAYHATLPESSISVANTLQDRITESEKRDEINQRVVDIVSLSSDKDVLALYKNVNKEHEKEGHDLTERGPIEFIMDDMHKKAGVDRTVMEKAVIRGQSQDEAKRVDASLAKRYMPTPNLQAVPTATDYFDGRDTHVKQDSISM